MENVSVDRIELLGNSTNSGTADPCAHLDVTFSDGLEDFTFLLNNVMLTAVVVLGFVGNGITIVVLTRRNMMTSTNCFLLALAVADSGLLICTFFLICLKSPDVFPRYYHYFRPYMQPFIYPLGLTFQTCVIWLTVSFTFERYIAVCHPLHSVRMCTLRRAKVVVAVVATMSFLYNLTRWLESRVGVTTCDGVDVLHVAMTELGEDMSYLRAYFMWLYLPFMCVVPVILLATLNALLIAAVRRSARRRRDVMNVREAKENNVTIMLVSVVVVFLVCQVPALVYNVTVGIDVRATSTGMYPYLNHVRNFAVTLNSAINFILYCALGQQFRKTLVQTFAALLRSSKRIARSKAPNLTSSGEFTTLQKPARCHHQAVKYEPGRRGKCCRNGSDDSNGKHEHCHDDATTEVFVFSRE